MKALESIIKNHKDLSTFEDFSMDVVLPSCAKKDQGFYSGLSIILYDCHQKSFIFFTRGHYYRHVVVIVWIYHLGMDGKVDKRDVLTLSNLAAALLDTQNLPHLSSVNSNFISLPDGVSDTENHY